MLSGRETRPDSPLLKGWYDLRLAMYEVTMCPAEWRVLAYVAPGLPMLHTSRGTGFAGGITMAKDWGIDAVVLSSMVICTDAERDLRVLGGLLSGFGTGDSASEDVSGGVGRDCFVFFCLRNSRLFRPARRLIASLLRYSVAGIISGSTAVTGLTGLTTCARVGAIDILQWREKRDFDLRLEMSRGRYLLQVSVFSL